MGKHSKFLIEPPHTVMAAIGAYAGAVRYSPAPSWVNNNAFGLLVKPAVLPGYFYLWLNSKLDLSSVVAGTGQPYVQRQALNATRLVLPPPSDQRRIVDLMDSIGTYVGAVAQFAEDARTARNAVLHELLTAGGDQWTETTLGEVALVVNGSTPSTRVPEYWDGDIPWITTTELTACDGGYVASANRRISTTALAKGGARIVTQGATLLGTTATIGTVAFTLNELSFNQQISALLPKTDSLHGEFLFLWARNNRLQFENLSAGTSFKRISTSNLKNIIMSLPPIAIQQAIINDIAAMDIVIQTTDQAVKSAKQLRAGLAESLLSGDHKIPETYDRLLGAA
jgi:type I restriction enzyme S subunit